jgi:Contractile injection system tape measure protein
MIQIQSIEVSFEELSDTFAIQNRISELYRQELLPKMEQLFDEFAGEQNFISYDVLNIDCGRLPDKHWEEYFVEESLRKLREELSAAHKNRTATIENGTTKLLACFIYFLENGYLPWNSRIASMKVLEQITIDAKLKEALRGVILNTPSAAYRLVHTFSDDFISKIIAYFSEASAEATGAHLLKYKDRDPGTEKRKLQMELLEALCRNENLTMNIPEANKADEKNIGPPVNQPVYIWNAGLVLLHPFLQQLFEGCGLRNKRTWTDSAAPYTALQMLHYLVRGKEYEEELNPLLAKILCGIDPEDMTTLDSDLPDTLSYPCDSLLSDVISYLTALKNTSIQTLRETFLQRCGKLTRTNQGWLLQVEYQSLDVLVARLPWGIGAIKLPWMPHIIYTEWV